MLIVAGYVALRPERLPPADFDSVREEMPFQNQTLLERAWALPVARSFPQPLVSQSNPSACGPTSVANVLQSFKISSSPDAVAAHGTGCFYGFCFAGLTLEQLATATRETNKNLTVSVIRPKTLEEFRALLRQSNALSDRFVINFNRYPLFGTGGGHHSPIGGYLEAEDLVFVLDVNANYRPWLVSSARLFEAMDTVDSSSGEKRGLLKMAQAN